MNDSKDSLSSKNAWKLFETAFKKFPDSINETGLYYGSILASELEHYDTAFEYVTILSELEKDEEGYPGWYTILGDYAQEDYENLIQDQRWKTLEAKAKAEKSIYFEKLNLAQTEFFKTSNAKIEKSSNPKKLYKSIKKFNPYLPKKEQNYSISFQINDSTRTAYLVHLPKDYNPKKNYPTLLFLHGAVHFAHLSEFQVAEQVLAFWNRFYPKYAARDEVVLVFPSGDKTYNWMSSDDGFFMVPEIVRELKAAINIDDNKIFISGHSNGATGSFSYAVKQATPFAGFYGFNTRPRVETGGTFIENLSNRSFINFSTDQDYYYPTKANDSLTALMQSLKIDYAEQRFIGLPHWLPQFDASEPAYETLFSDLKQRERQPFPKRIQWEFDDENYGQMDWLSHLKLDTLAQRKNWHKTLNFDIVEWQEYDDNDSLVNKVVDLKAFVFPRQSGKVIADYKDNIFHIKTSNIKSFQIDISPEMVDIKKKIKVYVNDKLYFRKRLDYNADILLQHFESTKDRKQLWVNKIDIEL